ncbi:formate/nitrite transporter family protein [Halorussus gelatinilyticus]|uniref:Formate/nitrite transporter family protein n=1 Tax=Halorussus gelatinilyticus TaxID=2937524 RepID=A0A8U0IIJ7_9EURY|nr:formate/nitrite transporter family protein [Halorussus gelatinilyticus]UPW00491.1 formate/nitrite transporter family protein [Halorussus gelatinilyticus]
MDTPKGTTVSEEAEEDEESTPRVRRSDRAASGAPAAGWALGDRFAWEEIHQRLLASAEEAIDSTTRELFFSGLTAGFAIVLTFIGYAVGSANFPNNHFLATVLYPIGFLYIILGRYELYTENTLPPVKLVLTRLASLPLLLRMWTVVLTANIVGAAIGAFVLANTQVLSPEAMRAGVGLVQHGLEVGWWDVFFKAVFAGWLVAGVVWLGTGARDTISRLIIIYLVFYMIPTVGLFHVVSSGAEALFFVFLGVPGPGLLTIAYEFWLPVLLGNTFGGVVLVALVSYAQSEHRRYPEIRVLSTRELLFSLKGGRPFDTPRPGIRLTDESEETGTEHD